MKLTQTVKKGGCAAKIAALELRQLLGGVKFPAHPAALEVDGKDFDDAAVYVLNAQTALVQTIDFFTPILDSPYDFGRVAAANAISDVYAMGGRPTLALGVLAFPLAELPREVVTEVLQGGCDVMARAGVALAGGHSIDDDSLKFGLAVTGFVHPEKIWKNTGARAGDDLLLTKALGTGTLTAGLKRGELSEADISTAIESMAALNNVIDVLEPHALDAAVHGATDVTGFGLSGHGMQMARASSKSLEIDFASIPQLPRAMESLRHGFLTKAHKSNAIYTADFLRAERLSAEEELLIHDPQTSGGLLLSVAPEHSSEVLERLAEAFPSTRRIGRVLDKSPGQVVIVGR